jgi:hypothetical protein
VNIWSLVALAYVVVRTVAAGALLVLAIRRRASGVVAAHAISDASAALLVSAYALHPLRAALGVLVVPLFVVFLAWELLSATQRLDLLGETPDSQLSDAEMLGWTARWFWDALNIIPVFVIGAMVVGNAVFYGIDLPGTPSALKCGTEALTSGGTLTLKMRTPHGTELGVFTPHRGYLSLRAPLAARTAPEVYQLEHQNRLDLRPEAATAWRHLVAADELVFVDAGTYTFSMGAYKDPSRAFTCVVRYRP